jgi:hypothetical protein
MITKVALEKLIGPVSIHNICVQDHVKKYDMSSGDVVTLEEAVLQTSNAWIDYRAIE